MNIYKFMQDLNVRPEPFQYYTAKELWTDPHIAANMLNYHLNDTIDAASRNHPFIERSTAWIAERFDLSNGTAVADFGCGPGLYSIRLARTGARVTGIDFSENSIRYAKQAAATENLPVNYVLEDYLNFETTDRFDLIIMIMCDYTVLSPAQRKHLLSRFHSLLKPGGAILLDVYTLNMFNQREEAAGYEYNQMDGFWSAEDYYAFVNTFKYEPELLILDQYTIVLPDEVRRIYNWMQCFDRTSLEQEFQSCGLQIHSFHANVAGDAYDPESTEMAVIATKTD